MIKLVGIIIALMMTMGIIGAATFANFINSEPSSGNQWAAGTLALKTNDADGVSGTLNATTMAPGDIANSGALELKNVGTADGATLDIVFDYAKSDGIPNSVVKDADDVAALMQVTALTYGVTNLLATLTNTNSNTYIDVQDLTNAANLTRLASLSGLNAGDSKDLVIAVQLRGETGNDFDADGIDITMTFTLKQ